MGKMLHMLLLVDWLGDLALADFQAPDDEDDFDEVENDVRDAFGDALSEHKQGPGPWVFDGSWSGDGDDPEGPPKLDGEWRRLTAEEAVRWCETGLLWAKPAYLVGD